MKPTLRIACATTAALLLVSGCTDPARFENSQDPNKNTKQGALIGGIIGAATGLLTAGDDKAESAIIGAAVGAGAGALIGSQLDAQEAALRKSLGSDVGIKNTGQELILTMPQDILFAVDSATLTGSLRGDLVRLAGNLEEYPDSTIDVIGHTDNTGSAEHNQALSARRAQAVSAVLRDNGVSDARLRAFGRGEDEPVATNLTAEGRKANRRVVIVIRPNV